LRRRYRLNAHKNTQIRTPVPTRPTTRKVPATAPVLEKKPWFAVLMGPEPEPPEGLETTAVTVNNEPSVPVDVNVIRVCDLKLVLVVSLVTKELAEEKVCVDWLVVDVVSCNDEEEVTCALVGDDDDVLKLELERGLEDDEENKDVGDVVVLGVNEDEGVVKLFEEVDDGVGVVEVGRVVDDNDEEEEEEEAVVVELVELGEGPSRRW